MELDMCNSKYYWIPKRKKWFNSTRGCRSITRQGFPLFYTYLIVIPYFPYNDQDQQTAAIAHCKNVSD